LLAAAAACAPTVDVAEHPVRLPVLGICNGFQILCEAHLLPGALIRNAGRLPRLLGGDVLVEQLGALDIQAEALA